MNKQITLICGAALLLILLIGCTQPATCGNGICEDEETQENCSIQNGGDCPPIELCGNELCDKGETIKNCPTDCSKEPTECTDECGNGTCDYIMCKKLPCPCLETIDTCPQDCESTTPTCGDGTCTREEGIKVCPEDCLAPIRPPQSPVIKSVSLETKTPIIFNGRTTQTQQTVGDLWFSTWADNNNLYMSWGDGGGFENLDPTDVGIAEVNGSVSNFVGTNVFFDPQISPPECAGINCKVPIEQKPPCCLVNDDKPSSLLYVNNKLYGQFHSPLGDPAVGYLADSNDYGITWERHKDNSPWTAKFIDPRDKERTGSNFRNMFFINMGKNYELNTDGYVYAYGIGKEWGWEGSVYLARVKKEEIIDYTKYDYFSGKTGDNPTWSTREENAVPLQSDLFIDQQFSAIYHPGINRYLIMNQYLIYDAPNPWGPWTTAGQWVKNEWFGYMPGIISKDLGQNSFWFTISGQPGDLQDVSYKLNLGKITMELEDSPPTPKEFCGDGICNENRDTCLLDCNYFTEPNFCGTTIPQSPVITSVSLESTIPTYVTNYSEGDIWRITEAKDGTTYTAWGDGGGFSNSPFAIPHDIKTHPGFYYTGVGKLTGTFPNNLTGENLYVGDTWVGPSDDKPYSLLAIEDTLYITMCKINEGAFCYLGYSTNGGNTFTMNKDTADQTSPFEFINMGQNYELNTDGYVYVSTVSIGDQIRGALYLGRVPAKQILDVSAYEYYSSENPINPTWSSNSSNAKPILPAGGVYNVMNGITYHPELDRFILMTEVNVYDSPNPWGPWTCGGTWLTEETSENWQGGYYPYIIPKETNENSFYFTLAGQGDTQGDYMKYRFNLGKIIMDLTDSTNICGDNKCDEKEAASGSCPQDCPK